MARSPNREDVVVRFGADTSAFRRAIANLAQDARTRLTSALDIGAEIGIGAGLAGGGIVAGLAAMTNQLDEMGKAAQGLSLSVEALRDLQFAVRQTSTLQADQFNDALQTMIEKIGDASQGSKAAQQQFADLGLSWERLATLGTDDAFIAIADAISKVEDPYRKATLAQQIFEEDWRELLPTLNEGRAGLEALIDQSSKIGGATTEAAAGAAELKKQLDAFNATLDALAFKYGPPVLQTINGIIKEFTGFGATVREEGVKALADLDARIRESEEALEKFGEFFTGDEIKRREREIADLKRQYLEYAQSLGEVLDQEEALARKRKEPAAQDPGVPPADAVEKETDKTRRVREKAAREMESLETERERTIRELGDALRRFRAGEISDVGLGIATGALPPETVEVPGAFGTLSNLTRPETTLSVKLSEEDLFSLPDEIESALARGNYRVEIVADVIPQLVPGSAEEAQLEADQRGADQ